VTIRVNIKQATGLPPSLSNFVFCQYTIWGHPDAVVVAPVNAQNNNNNNNNSTEGTPSVFKFDHSMDFTIPVTEEFAEHAAEGALSIEVLGHRSAGNNGNCSWPSSALIFPHPQTFDCREHKLRRSLVSLSGFSPKAKPGWEVEQRQLAKVRSLADRWSELTRKIELWVEIHELNEQGEYTPVEVQSREEMLTGGIYQLRQGQQRRIHVRVNPVQNSGTLPIICEAITSIAVGSVCVRSRLQKPLDSYQEEDLSVLREKWSDALMRRRQYLDRQIQRIVKKEGST
jgi:kinesin family member 13